MPRTDVASRVIAAPSADVYTALVERDALLEWLPPEGMTAAFERFDPCVGGGYRLVLTQSDPGRLPGKTTSDSDVVEARYVELAAGERVVQTVDFESDDAAFAGTMTMTWEVTAVEGGTRVDITAEGVPDGISAEDHATGLRSSLSKLAAYLGSDKGRPAPAG